MRKCSKCGKKMESGFIYEFGFELIYYCSEDCLHEDFTQEEYEELYEGGHAFYTEWEEEEEEYEEE